MEHPLKRAKADRLIHSAAQRGRLVKSDVTFSPEKKAAARLTVEQEEAEWEGKAQGKKGNKGTAWEQGRSMTTLSFFFFFLVASDLKNRCKKTNKRKRKKMYV